VEGVTKGQPRQAPTAAEAAATARQISLTQSEIQQARELLESVMTIAAHGILYRWGQALGARVLSDANRQGGNPVDGVAHVLVQRGWAREVKFYSTKVQVIGSLEAKQNADPCCHIMRGIIHVVAAGGDGGVVVREEKCAGQGAPECTFSITRGGRL
jgi:predicted hydrocarbon binding protein